MKRYTLCTLLALAIGNETFGAPSKKVTPPPASPKQEVTAPSMCAAPSAARITLSDRPENWPCNTFVKATFLYWYAAQDGMTLATSSSLQSNSTVALERGTQLLMQPFSYDPGFKIELGFGFDEWELASEYTWVRQSTTANSSAPADTQLGGTGVWVMGDWFIQGVGSNDEGISATAVSSQWKLAMDQVDTTANYFYLRNPYLTLSPYGGVRAVWLRQSLQIDATVPSTALTVGQLPLASLPIYSHNTTHSWGLGPIVGGSVLCRVGDSGFRLEGQGNAGFLFTQYTSLYHSEKAASASATPTLFSIQQNNYNTVRAVGELGMGLGWGSYLSCNQYHIDLSLDYTFQVFWNQNMMRTLVDEFELGVSTSNDLFFHGLNFTTRFDF